MKDESGRLSGYGYHGDRRMKRNKTRQAQTDADVNPVCDRCGRKNAKVSTGWQMLCIECRKIEESEDDDYGYDR
jgi:hypothetical protein